MAELQGMSFSAAQDSSQNRVEFMHRTYQHLAVAIGGFMGIEALLFNIPGIESLVATMMGGRYSWLLVLGLYMVVSMVAEKWARSPVSAGMQYLGLGLFVVAEAILFLPLLFVAIVILGQPDLVATAGVITGVTFAGLTAMVLISKKDFSFLGSILRVAGFVALGLIVASILFGFTLGTLFSAAMALFAAGAILYDTSNLVHHYRSDQHVAASLSLFASVGLLFWYVLQLVMAARD